MRAERHGDGDSSVELHDRGGGKLRERVIQSGDAGPVRLRRGSCPGVARGDRGLERVRAEGMTEFLGACEGGESASNEDLIPAGAVLVEQEDGFARRAGPSSKARRLDLHQSDEAVDLRECGHELGEDPAEAECLRGDRWSHPVATGGGRVPLVEDQVDDLEHRGEASDEVGPPRDLEGNLCLGKRPLGPHDPLGDG